MSPTSPAPHSAPWTTPSGMKYLGPHTDTAPLEVTLVLRRRHGALPRSASWPQAPQWPRARIRPAMRRGRGRSRAPARLRPAARTQRDRRCGEPPRAAPCRRPAGARAGLRRAARPLPARRRERTLRRLRPCTGAARRGDRGAGTGSAARRAHALAPAQAAPFATYTPIQLGAAVRLSRRLPTAAARRSRSSSSAAASAPQILRATLPASASPARLR